MVIGGVIYQTHLLYVTGPSLLVVSPIQQAVKPDAC